jgi:hypothetical protein
MSVKTIAAGAAELTLAAIFLGYELRKILDGGLSGKPKLKLPAGSGRTPKGESTETEKEKANGQRG